MDKKHYDYLFKFLVLGEQKVGKTALISRYADDKFNENYIYTIGNQKLYI